MFEIKIEDHCSKLISSLQQSFESCKETNCTLMCEGKIIKCHKYLLVAFSNHFKSLFTVEYSSETSVIIYVTNMKFEHLKVLIDSIYYGKLKISKDQFPELLKSAQSLGFTHLCNTDSWNFTTTEDSGEPPTNGNAKVEVCNKSNENAVEKTAVNHKTSPNNSQIGEETVTNEKSAQHLHDVEVSVPVNLKSGQHCAPCVPTTVSKPLANVAPNQVPCKPALAPKVVAPQLFSEANSILSRCLELISKPVSNVTQSVPVSTSAPSNAMRPYAQVDQNYCQMPVQMNSNSYVNYNVGKAVEAQYAARGYSDDISIAAKNERIRSAEQLSKIHVHGFIGNKPIAMSYPKGFGKPEVQESMSAASWRYAHQFPQTVACQRPRMFTPVSITQNQKEEMNPHLRNFTGHPNSEAIRAAAMRQRPIPKLSPDFHQNFAQSFSPYDPKLQYPKCLSSETRPHPHSPATKFDNPNSIRRNSMSHSIENRTQFHSSSVEHEPNLLSQALIVPLEARQTQVSANEKNLSKDPFQALIAAKAAFKKKRDDEESSEKSYGFENQSNSSRPCSTNSCSSATNSILGGRLESQNTNETSLKPQTNPDESSGESEKNVYGEQTRPGSNENSTHNKSEDHDVKTPDKLMQVVEECDLFIEEISEEDIEGEECEDDPKCDDSAQELVCEQRLLIQPPIKKRKCIENEQKIAKCEECGKVVSCIYYLQEHIRVKHKKQNLVCTEMGCDFAVLDRSKFNNHLIDVHGKVRKRGRNKE